MQADEVLYLHPDRVRLQGPAIDVDADPLPDVVLEVDHTTDVRRRKLGIYMESGFPEIWVLVPWESSVRRPRLAIHVRRDDGYREERSSRAFPGWRAEEIFRALTEASMSAGAWRALERVARAMGAREGTKPEDDPLMRSHSAQVRAEGRAEGHREGRAQGHLNAVVQVLQSRRIAVTLDAAEEGIDLYQFAPRRDKTIHHAVGFFIDAVEEPELVLKYAKTNKAPGPSKNYKVQDLGGAGSTMGWIAPYLARFPDHPNSQRLKARLDPGQTQPSSYLTHELDAAVRRNGFSSEWIGVDARCFYADPRVSLLPTASEPVQDSRRTWGTRTGESIIGSLTASRGKSSYGQVGEETCRYCSGNP